jgi:hypothetical protein
LIVYGFSGLTIDAAPFKIVVSITIFSVILYRHVTLQTFHWNLLNRFRGGLLGLAFGSSLISIIGRATYQGNSSHGASPNDSTSDESHSDHNEAIIILWATAPVWFFAGSFITYHYRKKLTENTIRIINSPTLKGKYGSTMSTIRSTMHAAVMKDSDGAQIDTSAIVQVEEGLRKLDEVTKKKKDTHKKLFSR